MNAAEIARSNRGRILRVLMHSEPVSRAHLASATGLSLATVSRTVTQLAANGLVLLTEAGRPTGGRPRGLVALAPGAAATLAIDVADHHTEIVIYSLAGAVLSREDHSVPVGTDPDERLAHTLRLAEGAAAEWRSRTRLLAVGVSIPGPVDDDGVVQFAPALGWHHVSLRELLEGILGLPVAVHNDANLIAVAEARAGAVPGTPSLVALAVFDGVGSGIVVDGRLWGGAHGASGQIGRMLLETSSVEHIYVGFGDLESRLGTEAVVERARAAGLTVDAGTDTWEQVLVALPRTSAPAAAFAAGILDEFAMALINTCALVDPEVIVLAGRFAPLADHLIPEFRRRLTGRVLHVPRLVAESTPIPGTLLGAAIAAEDTFGAPEHLLDAITSS